MSAPNTIILFRNGLNFRILHYTGPYLFCEELAYIIPLIRFNFVY
jgi:hypothetical protein